VVFGGRVVKGCKDLGGGGGGGAVNCIFIFDALL